MMLRSEITPADMRLTPGSTQVPSQCPMCHRNLTLNDFYRTTRGNGYQRVCKSCYRLPRKEMLIETRREDLEFMAATGETVEGAAARLGLSEQALYDWCRKHAMDLWRQLQPEPVGHVRQGRIARSA